MSKNLNDLNNILFDTLEGVKDGTIDAKKAQTIVNIGNTLVNAGKLQLQAYKSSRGKTGLSMLQSPGSPKIPMPEKGEKGRSLAARDYALEKGYKNVAEAIVAMGKDKFNKAVDKYMESLP